MVERRRDKRNPAAKAVRTPQFRLRIVQSSLTPNMPAAAGSAGEQNSESPAWRSIAPPYGREHPGSQGGRPRGNCLCIAGAMDSRGSTISQKMPKSRHFLRGTWQNTSPPHPPMASRSNRLRKDSFIQSLRSRSTRRPRLMILIQASATARRLMNGRQSARLCLQSRRL
jgi:hypothetical protein